ncbi:1-phosphatidylinositol-4-phosphate 5-kinase [Mycena pura]|uniref:1-phosphatidylinositol-4-phosphate 5-kinase n=1 Tax=Mycena pura TaxID=153505 RepID=A0AAD6VQG8_9AGAR|nr:1-phosphatidylinositol-4-phosphate 5-kinase [Mycena pura]
MSVAIRSPSPPLTSPRQSTKSSGILSPSQLSSTASFRTTPSSRSSSAHTVSQQDAGTHSPTHPHEVHVVKVTGDQLPQDPYFSHQKRPSDDGHRVGPPPPSPPASVDPADDLDEPPMLDTGPCAIFDEPEQIRQHVSSSSAASTSSLQTRADPLVRSSTDTRILFRTPTIPEYNLNTPVPAPSESLPDSSSKNISHPPDAYLHPPTTRPARRNTTGSTSWSGGSAIHPVRTSLHAQFGSQPFTYEAEDLEGELASDIQLHAEQIRRERQSKRAKQQQEAEAALTRNERAPARHSSNNDNMVLVGNIIGEDHVNYVLMYNMLTGIRVGVSRCQAKIKRPLVEEDFSARHKFSFDIIGNELTPSAKYDFKFKDYAPWVFRELREDHFHLDPADYLLSLTSKYILSELGSPGKSGSFFYFSRDYRFIIKTIRHSEHKFLLSILKQYYHHVKNNPHTLLSRFYGLHRVKLPRGRKIHFVIMNNLFPPHRDIHETFDLKGSTVGRQYPEDKAAANPRAVLKDLNWINRNKMLELGPEKRALLTEQLRRDAELLRKVRVMDYSLLIGIHKMERGNRDNVRRNTLKVFSPDISISRRTTSIAGKGGFSAEAIAIRRAMRESDPKRLGHGKGTVRLPEEDTGDRRDFLFYQDEGGIRATDEANEPMDNIYYLGVIDILTPYTCVKQLEHFWKGLSADRHKISPVEPGEYGDRFFAFMKAIMRGGGGGERFKPDFKAEGGSSERMKAE